MPPRQRPCTVCNDPGAKYTCASCRANYCAVACYKQHKETCSTSTNSSASAPPVHGPDFQPEPNPSPTSASASTPTPTPTPDTDAPLQDPTPLRPLTSLTWPYVPDTSAYPDPLTRDDPKPLQLRQYEAIATSPTIRTLLSNPRLRTLLASIDALRGPEREQALQRALGVDTRLLQNLDAGTEAPMDEDTRAFRAFAEAVEGAVRGGREDALGLDWD